jgi:hypothetical protein
LFLGSLFFILSFDRPKGAPSCTNQWWSGFNSTWMECGISQPDHYTISVSIEGRLGTTNCCSRFKWQQNHLIISW